MDVQEGGAIHMVKSAPAPSAASNAPAIQPNVNATANANPFAALGGQGAYVLMLAHMLLYMFIYLYVHIYIYIGMPNMGMGVMPNMSPEVRSNMHPSMLRSYICSHMHIAALP